MPAITVILLPISVASSYLLAHLSYPDTSIGCLSYKPDPTSITLLQLHSNLVYLFFHYEGASIFLKRVLYVMLLLGLYLRNSFPN